MVYEEMYINGADQLPKGLSIRRLVRLYAEEGYEEDEIRDIIREAFALGYFNLGRCAEKFLRVNENITFKIWERWIKEYGNWG